MYSSGYEVATFPTYSEYDEDVVRLPYSPYYWRTYSSSPHPIPVRPRDVSRTVARPFFGRSCCIVSLLLLISVGIVAAAIAFGALSVKNDSDSCPIITCPSGYVIDGTGTTCDALPTTSAPPCATMPLYKCPPGYELDSSGLSCNALSTQTASPCGSTNSYECPSGYTLSSSGLSCDEWIITFDPLEVWAIKLGIQVKLVLSEAFRRGKRPHDLINSPM
ncbi:hypothetical protein CAPTEDRAFT_200663 [Capitella teleta]|uniref:Uncharacterized protein n=1 Tax=Capitella teleta TaxID=283909 RepID=R7U2C5_CAPTE|nr:hypothetical protein CAPTEDRAFT_200663 [Capitella teleta]|eukprot:ELU00160.1 hypothetical protein CAPTEDRAFT_200663 [Capitella teleta]